MTTIKLKTNNVFIIFQQFSTTIYISILSLLIFHKMQLPLTTPLQFFVCMRKQVTKQSLLSSLWQTKIVNIFLNDSI